MLIWHQTYQDHSNDRKGCWTPGNGLPFPISSKGCFTCSMPQIRWYIFQALLHQCEALAGVTNSSVGPPAGTDPMTQSTSSRRSITDLHPAPSSQANQYRRSITDLHPAPSSQANQYRCSITDLHPAPSSQANQYRRSITDLHPAPSSKANQYRRSITDLHPAPSARQISTDALSPIYIPLPQPGKLVQTLYHRSTSHSLQPSKLVQTLYHRSTSCSLQPSKLVQTLYH